MSDTNIIVVSGYVVGKNVQYKETENSGSENVSSTLNLSIANNKRVYNRATEQWENDASFFNIRLFGKFAQTMKKFAKSGAKFTVTGKMDQQRWNAQDGSPRSMYVVLANNIEITKFPEDESVQGNTYHADNDANLEGSMPPDYGTNDATASVGIDIVTEEEIPNFID